MNASLASIRTREMHRVQSCYRAQRFCARGYIRERRALCHIYENSLWPPAGEGGGGGEKNLFLCSARESAIFMWHSWAIFFIIDKEVFEEYTYTAVWEIRDMIKKQLYLWIWGFDARAVDPIIIHLDFIIICFFFVEIMLELKWFFYNF